VRHGARFPHQNGLRVPRLVVAGTSSGVGKTTVATGLMAALRRTGHTVAPAKVGPDFIDPGYHGLATGRPGRNLDAWISGADAIAPLAARAATGADILVVEGVMGLFDGAADDGATASTAHVAKLLQAPVVLVVDAKAMSGSVAALVHGFATFDPDLAIGGVILNRVGSDGHETMLREALEPTGVPVLGVLRRDGAFTWRDRHLGLVPVVEQRAEVERSLDRLAEAITAGCDVHRIIRLATTAPPLDPPPLPTPEPQGHAVMAVAGGPAFAFVYPDNVEALQAAGAEIVPFDPLHDKSLPPGADGVYVGGGFPEVFAAALADNVPLLDDVRARAADLAIWAECGGLLWLCNSLDGHRLAGVVDADARMTERLSLGYRRATATIDNPLAAAGEELCGHEFHYSTVDPLGEALDLSSRFGSGPAGFATPSLLASYLHLHLGATPGPAERFVRLLSQRRCAREAGESPVRFPPL
jgi:cobyrinic acid a,c-diamide synthase